MVALNPLLPCSDDCRAFYDRYKAPLAHDFIYENDLPAVIDLSLYRDMEDYITKISFNKRYGVKQARKKGYFVERFHWQSFIGDIVEVNTSKEVRAGGPMRPAYLETVDQRGGYLNEYRPPSPVVCHVHCYTDWGVFLSLPGHKQGEVTVDKKLVGYISAITIGEYSIYSMIIGHGDHLKNDIMALLHIEVMKWIWENTKTRYLEYGTVNSGKQGLRDWKRYFLFTGKELKWQS